MNADVSRILLAAGLCLLAVQQDAVTPLPACGRQLERAEQSERASAVGELLAAPSFVPAREECFIHIAGGFFSRFDRRYGKAQRCQQTLAPRFGRCQGRPGGTRLCLKALKHRSPMVYLPEGSLELRTGEGPALSFEMEVLDYVLVRGQELPCYRLSAVAVPSGGLDGSLRAVLICTALGVEMPVLAGTLYLLSEAGECLDCYDIEIVGRNSVEAENHLLKVVEAASQF